MNYHPLLPELLKASRNPLMTFPALASCSNPYFPKNLNKTSALTETGEDGKSNKSKNENDMNTI